MAATSKHWADVQTWIYKVIDSCITPSQVLSAERLVRYYEKKYPFLDIYDGMYVIHQCLESYCNDKFNEIMSKKLKDEKRRSNCPDEDIH